MTVKVNTPLSCRASVTMLSEITLLGFWILWIVVSFSASFGVLVWFLSPLKDLGEPMNNEDADEE